jgi:hypothetical protein
LALLVDASQDLPSSTSPTVAVNLWAGIASLRRATGDLDGAEDALKRALTADDGSDLGVSLHLRSQATDIAEAAGKPAQAVALKSD